MVRNTVPLNVRLDTSTKPVFRNSIALGKDTVRVLVPVPLLACTRNRTVLQVRGTRTRSYHY